MSIDLTQTETIKQYPDFPGYNQPLMYQGFKITVTQDESAWQFSPRDDDNLGTFLTWQRRYNSPDDFTSSYEKESLENWARETARDYLAPWIEAENQKRTEAYIAACEASPNSTEDVPDCEEVDYDELPMSQVWEAIHKHNAVMPVYCYEHSGIAYRTESFACEWDSGLAGIIFVSFEDIRSNYMLGKDELLTPDTIEAAKSLLKSEVETYSAWANGEVYEYAIEDAHGDYAESVGGFYVERRLDEVWMQAVDGADALIAAGYQHKPTEAELIQALKSLDVMATELFDYTTAPNCKMLLSQMITICDELLKRAETDNS